MYIAFDLCIIVIHLVICNFYPFLRSEIRVYEQDRIDIHQKVKSLWRKKQVKYRDRVRF